MVRKDRKKDPQPVGRFVPSGRARSLRRFYLPRERDVVRFRDVEVFRAPPLRAVAPLRPPPLLAAPPLRPPLRLLERLVALPRPEPLFLPPPVSLLTVAQARRAASLEPTPRFS